MANASEEIVVGLRFTADTAQARQQLNDLKTSLADLGSLKTIDLNQGLTKEIESATVAAAKLKGQLEAATNTSTGNLDLTKFNKQLQSSGMTLDQYRMQLSALGPQGQQAFLSLAQSIQGAEVPLIRINKLFSGLWESLKRTVGWQISSTAIHAFMGAIQGAYHYAQDLNESLNNIRIVTGQSVDQMARFADQANKAARALSTTTTAYTDAALIYYQQGLDDTQVKERTDVTIKMANVSRQSAEEVSDQMTAVWNNFAKGGKDLESFADKMVALGASTASSSEEIASGLEKFASVADVVGLSFDYAAAALATVTATTRQSAETVGTAFKTLFARLEGLKLGETLEDGTDLNKYSKALDTIGVHIKDASGELRQMDDILDETGAKWQTLTKAQQMAVAQTVAGVRQYTQFIALMDNWDFFQENLQTEASSSGALQQQADIYAESWEAAQKRVRAASQAIYSDLIDDEFFIKLTNSAADFLGLLDKLIDAAGGLPGLLNLIGGALLNIFGNNITEKIRDVSYSIQNLVTHGKAARNMQAEAAQQASIVASQIRDEGGLEANAKADSYQNIAALQSTIAANAKNINEADMATYRNLVQVYQARENENIALAKKLDLLQQSNALEEESLEDNLQEAQVISENYKRDQQLEALAKKRLELNNQIKNDENARDEIIAGTRYGHQSGQAAYETLMKKENLGSRGQEEVNRLNDAGLPDLIAKIQEAKTELENLNAEWDSLQEVAIGAAEQVTTALDAQIAKALELQSTPIEQTGELEETAQAHERVSVTFSDLLGKVKEQSDAYMELAVSMSEYQSKSDKIGDNENEQKNAINELVNSLKEKKIITEEDAAAIGKSNTLYEAARAARQRLKRDIDQEAQSLKQAVKDLSIEDSEKKKLIATIDKLCGSYRKEGAARAQLTEAQRQGKILYESISKTIGQSSVQIADYARIMTTTAQTISGLFMGITAGLNAVKNFSNPDLSGWEKFSGLMMALPMVIGGFARAITAGQTAIDAFNLSQKATIATNTVLLGQDVAKTAAVSAAAIAQQSEAGATEANVAAVLKNVTAEQAAIVSKTLKSSATDEVKIATIQNTLAVAAEKAELDKETASTTTSAIASALLKQSKELETKAIWGKVAAQMAEYWWIGLIIGATLLLAVGIGALVNAYKAQAEAAKNAQQAAGATANAANETAKEYDTLKSKIEALKDSEKTLKTLTEGTKEWKDAVQDINAQVLTLINLFPQLKDALVFNNGVMGLDSGKTNSILDEYAASVARGQTAGMAARVGANTAQAQYQQSNVDVVIGETGTAIQTIIDNFDAAFADYTPNMEGFLLQNQLEFNTLEELLSKNIQWDKDSLGEYFDLDAITSVFGSADEQTRFLNAATDLLNEMTTAYNKDSNAIRNQSYSDFQTLVELSNKGASNFEKLALQDQYIKKISNPEGDTVTIDNQEIKRAEADSNINVLAEQYQKDFLGPNQRAEVKDDMVYIVQDFFDEFGNKTTKYFNTESGQWDTEMKKGMQANSVFGMIQAQQSAVWTKELEQQKQNLVSNTNFTGIIDQLKGLEDLSNYKNILDLKDSLIKLGEASQFSSEAILALVQEENQDAYAKIQQAQAIQNYTTEGNGLYESVKAQKELKVLNNPENQQSVDYSNVPASMTPEQQQRHIASQISQTDAYKAAGQEAKTEIQNFIAELSTEDLEILPKLKFDPNSEEDLKTQFNNYKEELEDEEIHAKLKIEAEEHELDSESLYEVGKAFDELNEATQASAKKLGKTSEFLEADAEAASDAATRYNRLQNAVLDLADNYDKKYKNALEGVTQALKDADKATTDEARAQAKADAAIAKSTKEFKQLRTTLSNLIGTSEKFIDNNFLKALDPKDVEKAANGDEAAIDRVRNAFIDAQAAANGLANTPGLESFKNQLNELEDGAIVDIDNTPFLQSLIASQLAAGATAEDIETLLSGFGIDADVTPFDAAMAEAADTAADAATSIIASSDAVVAGASTNAEVNSVTAESSDTIEDTAFTENITKETVSSIGDQVAEGDPATVKPIQQRVTKFTKTVTPNPVTETNTKEQTASAVKISNAHKSAGGHVGANTQRQASGGGGGKGGGGGGGGGGGKGSAPKKAKSKKANEGQDRYHEVNKRLDTISSAYDKVDAAKEKAYGKKHLENLQLESKLLKDQIGQLDIKAKEAEEYAKKDRKDVINLGAKISLAPVFDENGNISNYNKMQEARIAWYNKEMELAAKMSDDQRQEREEQIEEEFSAQDEILSNYEDSLQTRLDVAQETADAIRQYLDLQFEGLEYEIEIKMKVEDFKQDFFDFQLERIEDMASDTMDEVMAKYDKKHQYLFSDYKSQQAKAETSQQAMRNALSVSRVVTDEEGNVVKDENGEAKTERVLSDKQVEAFMNGDTSVLKTLQGLENGQQIIDEIMEQQSQYQDSVRAMYKDAKAMAEIPLQMFNEINEQATKTIERYSDLKEMNTYMIDFAETVGTRMTKLMSGQVAQAKQNAFEMQRLSMASSYVQMESNKKVMEDAEARYNQMKENQAEYIAEAQAAAEKSGIDPEKAKEAAQEAYDVELKAAKEYFEGVEDAYYESAQTFQDSMQEAAEAAKDAYESVFDSMLKEWESAIADTYKSIEELQNAFAQKKTLSEQFIPEYKQVYELSKMNRDIIKQIDMTDNVAAQRKLKEFQEEIIDLQNSGKKLSEYDLQYLQKKYDLKVAEIALEDAQNAKNQVRLSRDAEGNYSYVYTADESKTTDAAGNYEEKLYQAQDLTEKYLTSTGEQYIQTLAEMSQALAGLKSEDFANEEEYAAKQKEIEEYYSQRLTYWASQQEGALEKNQKLYNEDYSAYVEKIGNMNAATGTFLMDFQSFSTEFDDTITGQVFSSYDSLKDHLSGVLVSIEGPGGLLEASLNNYKQYYENIESTLKVIGVKLDTDYPGAAKSGHDKIADYLGLDLAEYEAFKQGAVEKIGEIEKSLTTYAGRVETSFGEGGRTLVHEGAAAIGGDMDNLATSGNSLKTAIDGSRNSLDDLDDSELNLAEKKKAMDDAAGAGTDLGKAIGGAKEKADEFNKTPWKDRSTEFGDGLKKPMDEAAESAEKLNKKIKDLFGIDVQQEIDKGVDVAGSIKYPESSDADEPLGALWLNIRDIVSGWDFDTTVDIIPSLDEVTLANIQQTIAALGKDITIDIRPHITAMSDGYFGDLDGDGKVTARDARLALQASAQKIKLTDEQMARADLTGDGKVTSADARQILRTAAKLISAVPMNLVDDWYAKASSITDPKAYQKAFDAFIDEYERTGTWSGKIASGATGMYTGEWGNEGKLAVLHEKELVLNQDDTKNILNVVSMVRDLAAAIDLSARAGQLALGGITATSLKNNNVENQNTANNITINAEFPNVSAAAEIEAAFNSLELQASQYAYQNN